MIKIVTESYELSTGKIIYPKCAETLLIEIKEGMGETVGNYAYVVDKEHGDSPDLTKEEARELALYMSKSWLEVANKIRQK